MILAIVIGFYVRLKGLGKWPLATDEYYFAKSVNNILASGLPRFECGGYYTRGILQQYIVAPLLFIFPAHQEFGLRIVPVICNLLTIPPLFWLGKKISGSFVACAAVVLFSFSLWEIEFARFARMYTPFQTIFMWYVFFLYKAIIDECRKSERTMLVLSFVSLFLYEGSIFLVLLNFFPLLYRKGAIKFDFLLFFRILILIIGYIYLSTDFRRLGVEGYIPSEIAGELYAGSGNVLLPILLIQDLGRNFLLLFGTQVILFVIAAASVIKFNTEIKNKLILFTGLLCALFNIFGLTVACLIAYLLMNGVERTTPEGRFFLIYFAVLISFFIFWLSFGYFSENWFHYFENVESFSLRKFLVLLLKYPNYLNSFIYPWLRTVPMLAICLCLGIFPVLMIYCFNPKESRFAGFRLLCMLVFSVIVVMGVINTNYALTRYTFFLYPLFSLLFISGIYYFIQILTKQPKAQITSAVMVLIVFFLITEDFSIAHMKNIDGVEYNFRTVYSRELSAHYYPRSDSRAVANFVNNTKEDGDLVISTIHNPEYYLDQLDYFYRDYKSIEFPGIIACSGSRNIWTNSLMIYKEKQLWDTIANHSGNVFIITKSRSSKFKSSATEEIHEKFSNNAVFTDVSKRITVYKVGSNNVQ